MSIESVIKRYARPGETEFTIHLDADHAFTFRSLRKYSEIKKFEADRLDYVDQVMSGPLRPGLSRPESREEAGAVYTISHLSVKPKISEADALRLCQEAGIIAQTLVRGIMENMVRAATAETQADIEHEKKTLRQTPGEES